MSTNRATARSKGSSGSVAIPMAVATLAMLKVSELALMSWWVVFAPLWWVAATAAAIMLPVWFLFTCTNWMSEPAKLSLDGFLEGLGLVAYWASLAAGGIWIWSNVVWVS